MDVRACPQGYNQAECLEKRLSACPRVSAAEAILLNLRRSSVSAGRSLVTSKNLLFCKLLVHWCVALFSAAVSAPGLHVFLVCWRLHWGHGNCRTKWGGKVVVRSLWLEVHARAGSLAWPEVHMHAVWLGQPAASAAPGRRAGASLRLRPGGRAGVLQGPPTEEESQRTSWMEDSPGNLVDLRSYPAHHTGQVFADWRISSFECVDQPRLGRWRGGEAREGMARRPWFVDVPRAHQGVELGRDAWENGGNASTPRARSL